MADEFICESELGTKEYWNHFYDEELTNFKEHGDHGDNWFGLKNTFKIIDWIDKNSQKKDFICDIGCGNGFILAQLAKRKFENLYGYDYSEKAIEFCQTQYSEESIHFKVLDILDENLKISQKFSVVIDKGTYDAICLMPGADITLNRRKYLQFLDETLEENGFLIIFTCNFTKDEMLRFLSNSFQLINEFETPQLSFGGKIGKQVTGLVLRRNAFLNKCVQK